MVLNMKLKFEELLRLILF